MIKSMIYKRELGEGIYTLPDVSHILNLPAGKVRRWMNDYWNTEFQQQSEGPYTIGDGKNKTTNFKTLIEFYVFYQLRELKISVTKIREAYQQISKILSTSHPFATVEILANKKDIFYILNKDNVAIDTKGNQIVFKSIIESFCKKIEFSENNLAAKFYPIGKEKEVVVDPHHQFGQPIISGTNILAETIFSMYESGEKESTISVLYDLKLSQIRDAIYFFQNKAA